MSDNVFVLIIGGKPYKYNISTVCEFSRQIRYLRGINPFFKEMYININVSEHDSMKLNEMIINYEKNTDKTNFILNCIQGVENPEIIFKIGLLLQNNELMLEDNNNTNFSNNKEAIDFIKERRELDFRYFSKAIDYLAENMVSPVVNLFSEDETDEIDEKKENQNIEIHNIISKLYPIRKDLLILVCTSDSVRKDGDFFSFATKINEENLYPNNAFLHYCASKIFLSTEQIEKYKSITAKGELNQLKQATIDKPLIDYLKSLKKQPASQNEILVETSDGFKELQYMDEIEIHEEGVYVIVESFYIVFRQNYFPEKWDFQIKERDNADYVIVKINTDKKEKKNIDGLIKFTVTLDEPKAASHVKITICDKQCLFLKLAINGKKYDLKDDS